MKPIEALSEIKKLLFGEATPETPETPEVPAEPETPSEPETPAEPEAPEAPETPAEPQDFSAQFQAYDEKFTALEKVNADQATEITTLKQSLAKSTDAVQKLVLLFEEYLNAPDEEPTESPKDGIRKHKATTKEERFKRMQSSFQEIKN